MGSSGRGTSIQHGGGTSLSGMDTESIISEESLSSCMFFYFQLNFFLFLFFSPRFKFGNGLAWEECGC